MKSRLNPILARSLRLATGLLLSAALAGCSMVRLGYGHLDTFAAWQVDSYFDLESSQRQEFLARFERLHEWHRYDQLPEYVRFLGGFRERLQRGLAREDVVWFVEGIKARYRIIAKRAAGDAAEMLVSITPQQVEALQRQWERDNRKFVREYRLENPVEDRKRARARRALSQIRDWAGALDPEQESRVIAMANELPLIDHLRHEDRLRRQREFLELLKLRADKDAFRQRLAQWLLEWERGRAREYERALDEWWAKRVDLFVAVDRILTPHQRAHALGRLQDYMHDFTRLSQRPAPAAAAAR
jgi:hypothetical protein